VPWRSAYRVPASTRTARSSSDRTTSTRSSFGTAASSGRIAGDWRERFARSYDAELQAWLDAVARAQTSGPSSWDGCAATAVAVAAVDSLRTGQRTPVPLEERPSFYDPAAPTSR
jgi:predicted dehydrogenase